MKKSNLFSVLLFVAITFSLSSCSWKPDVSPVSITAPWEQLQLPIADNAVVWGSTATEFKAVHKSNDTKEVADTYKQALEKQGWKMTKYEPGDITYLYFLGTDGNTYQLESYDFENTGIIIRRQ